MTGSRVGGRLGDAVIEEKGLMDMDNTVVIAGGRGCKGIKWQWKKYNKDKNKINKIVTQVSILWDIKNIYIIYM